jgi:hypothetical protein
MKVFIITICAFCLASTLSAQEKSNTPKAKYKSGSSVVTVWENEAEGKYGTYTKLNFKVERIYKKDEEWISTNNFTLEQLMELKSAIDKAILEEGVEVKD